MAQVVAHLIGNEEVTGSTPVISLQKDDLNDHPFLFSEMLSLITKTTENACKKIHYLFFLQAFPYLTVTFNLTFFDPDCTVI